MSYHIYIAKVDLPSAIVSAATIATYNTVVPCQTVDTVCLTFTRLTVWLQAWSDTQKHLK